MGDERADRTSDSPPVPDVDDLDAVSDDGHDPVSDGDGDDSDDDGDDSGDDLPGHVLPDEVEYPGSGEGATTALPGKVEGWRRRSAAGAMLTGFAFGLREAFEPTFNEPAIVLETSGTPPKDLPVEADLENLRPKQSVVRIRRWLLTDTPGGDGGDPDGTGAAPTTEAGRTTEAGSTTDAAPTADAAPPAGGEARPRVTEIQDRTTTRKRTRRFGRSAGRKI